MQYTMRFEELSAMPISFVLMSLVQERFSSVKLFSVSSCKRNLLFSKIKLIEEGVNKEIKTEKVSHRNRVLLLE